MSKSLGERFRQIDLNKEWSKIFSKVQSDSEKVRQSCKVASRPENAQLNRYRDVLPWDHSCVFLSNGGYINASRIPVNSIDREYILTQGPMPNTCTDFWRMVWEMSCCVIVMLNRFVEKNQVKCYQYFPLKSAAQNNESKLFTDFKVMLLSEKDEGHYCVRKLQIHNLELNESREVVHLQYRSWPDFGVPETTDEFLEFLMKVRQVYSSYSNNQGPVVIHCSAGIGRSGTFIMVDAALEMVCRKNPTSELDIPQMVVDFRKYRMGLIQTPGQLRFCWKAIVDALENVRWHALSAGESMAEQVENEMELNNPRRYTKRVTNGPLPDAESTGDQGDAPGAELFARKRSRLSASSSSSSPAGDDEDQLPRPRADEQACAASSQPAPAGSLTERYEQRLRRREQKNTEMKERLVKIKANLKRCDQNAASRRKRIIVGGTVAAMVAAACLYVYYKSSI